MTFDPNSLGKRIIELRKNMGLNQSELANKAKIDQSSLNKYEKGKQCPHLETLIILASALDTSLDYLVFGVKNGKVTIDSNRGSESTSTMQKALEALSYLIGEKYIYFVKSGKKYLNFFDYKNSPVLMEFVGKLMSLQNVWSDLNDETYRENAEKLIERYTVLLIQEENRTLNLCKELSEEDTEDKRIEAAKESLGD